MNNKLKKKIQIEYAKKNLKLFIYFLKSRFEPRLDFYYIREIKRFSTGFNIRLKREEKLLFCKKCNIFWDSNSREIRLNSTLKSKEYICKNCGFVRRFKYKK